MTTVRHAQRWLPGVLLVAALMVAGSGTGLVALWRAGEGRDILIALLSRLSARPVETADDAVPPASGLHPVGVNTFLEQEVEPAKRRQAVAMARAAGFGAIRQQFPWAEIEPDAKGVYWDARWGRSTWEKYDEIVALAAEYGLEVLARLDTSPAWARPGNPWPATPPANVRDYGDFVAAVVARYAGRVRYFQLWNEPNLASEWGQQPVDAAAFTALLAEGYRRAKAVNPDAVIVAPALAPTVEESPWAQNELHFLEALYAAGAGEYFDVLAVQAYGLRDGPDDRRLSADRVNFSRPLLVREIMVRHGDAHKPVWATELGWNALPPDFPGPAVYGRVTEEQQARYTVRALERIREEWPWLQRSFIWYLKRADASRRDEAWYYFRLLEPDFTPLPVYWALSDYLNGRYSFAPHIP
ncbi:MAG TPA: cellulase family glycosylhydrolase [Chloroflexota bacterium]|nr:cellulase family glycosylhydrolase [Chloroflexota bacterium]HZU08016.1 cellulase family glycosylhydrolase [Chloroflexota bacterium]